jgi:hypothetical protein
MGTESAGEVVLTFPSDSAHHTLDEPMAEKSEMKTIGDKIRKQWRV